MVCFRCWDFLIFQFKLEIRILRGHCGSSLKTTRVATILVLEFFESTRIGVVFSSLLIYMLTCTVMCGHGAICTRLVTITGAKLLYSSGSSCLLKSSADDRDQLRILLFVAAVGGHVKDSRSPEKSVCILLSMDEVPRRGSTAKSATTLNHALKHWPPYELEVTLYY